MKPPEQLKQQILKEKRQTARLQMAASRVEAAELERIWALVAAHAAGLSIRQIAATTGLSSSRVHQLLHTDEAKQSAWGLSTLSSSGGSVEEGAPDPETPTLTAVQQQLADEGEVLRWCIEWLEQLSRGEPVVVNLRPPSDARTAFVSFDQVRVVQVLKRIAAELDRLSGRRTPSETLDATGDAIAAGVKHRQRLAEPEPQLASRASARTTSYFERKDGFAPAVILVIASVTLLCP